MTAARNAFETCPTHLAWNARFSRVTCTACLLTGMLVAGNAAFAQGSAQTTAPDAQVESNVLKALAGAPELATESITTKTMYGTVTLSGTVRDENTRRRAENLAANADGVRKVVDELRLNDGSDQTTLQAANQQPAQLQSGPMQQGPQAQPAPQPGMVLQSDGTYAPAPAGTSADPAPGTAPAAMAQRNNPDADYQLDQQRDQQNGNTQQGGNPQQNGNPQQQQPMPNGPTPDGGMPNQQSNNQQPGNPYPNAYPQANPNRRPLNPQGYPYPQQQDYPQQGSPNGAYAQQQQGYPSGGQPIYGNDGQTAGIPVTVPSGALLRVRLNRTLSSNRTPAGTVFDGVVTNDVVANGFVAIPRGASVQGTVLEAKSSGVLKGRGELSIQLTQVTLAGKTYPIVSDVWAHNGGDKTIETINKTAGFGAGGALLGALAGGGEGAAIGAGVGAALGLGSSAASGNGQVFVPAEALVTFHVAQPATVQTVSEQEMQRLAYGVPPGADGARYRRGPRVVVGPTYYPPCGPYPCQPGVQYGVPAY